MRLEFLLSKPLFADSEENAYRKLVKRTPTYGNRYISISDWIVYVYGYSDRIDILGIYHKFDESKDLNIIPVGKGCYFRVGDVIKNPYETFQKHAGYNLNIFGEILPAFCDDMESLKKNNYTGPFKHENYYRGVYGEMENGKFKGEITIRVRDSSQKVIDEFLLKKSSFIGTCNITAKNPKGSTAFYYCQYVNGVKHGNEMFMDKGFVYLVNNYVNGKKQ